MLSRQHGLMLRLLDPLQKILPGQALPPEPSTPWSALRGERTAVQIAIDWRWQDGQPFEQETVLSVRTTARSLALYDVALVPVRLAAWPDHDEQYLTDQPGLLPDRLVPCPFQMDPDHAVICPVRLLSNQIHVIWLEWQVPDDAPAGPVSFQIQLAVQGEAATVLTTETTLQVIDMKLPPQTLIHTEWFHTDCLADYYQVPVFSQAHWQAIGAFMRMAADHGINMILTPLFTPPLDTAIGGERTTVQLIDVLREGGEWTFDFARLRQWIDLARASGIEYFEMSHLFTQWGAAAAPAIYAGLEQSRVRVFGWDTDAAGPEYAAFLAAFLPRLTEKLRQWGLSGRVFFHVSDEPQPQHLEQYRRCKAMITPWLDGFPIIDALSDLELYQSGAVDHPIPANNHIDAFLDAGVPHLWTYYCCGQTRYVSNRFMALPSLRNRVLGVQLYLFRIEGFLHWGYNFYNSRLSRDQINPFAVTDADASFPAGDPFLVYPGSEYQPEPSLRLKVLEQGLQDQRALQCLEALTSRRDVVDLIERESGQAVTFSSWPPDAGWLLRLRHQVNLAIAEAVENGQN